MRRVTVKFCLGLAGIVFASVGASAQPDDEDALAAPYRTYSPYTIERPDLDRAAELIAREREQFLQQEALCEAGDTAACGKVGVAYVTGIGAPQVRPVGAIYLAEACAADGAVSCFEAGMLAETSPNEQGQIDAAQYFDRACELGSAEGCIAFAEKIKSGAEGEYEAGRAEAVLRQTCERGSTQACRDLASSLLANESDPGSASEGVALLMRECRGGDLASCERVSYLFEESSLPGNLPHEAEVLYLGCNAGGPRLCKLLADRAMLGQGVVQDEPYAMLAYDRACALDDVMCEVSQMMRTAPRLRQECDRGDVAACARMGEITSYSGTIYYDPDAAVSDFAAACRGGIMSSCPPAGYWILGTSPEPLSPEAVTAREFLELGCEAGDFMACMSVADKLYGGGVFGTDRARALELYAIVCAQDRDKECEILDKEARNDPAAPLPVAGSNFLPPDDPETGESSIDRYWAEMLEEEEDPCTTNTVEFRGQVYSDTVCNSTPRVIGGRALRPGQAPWQALIWRPERMREIRGPLSAQGRVKCGGSVIARGWVLTAAHCMYDYDRSILGRGFTIRLGVHNPRAAEGVTYPIVAGYVHPNYDSSDLAYDVALIRYDADRGQRAGPTNSIATILPDRETVESRPIADGMPVYVYGWGWTRASGGTSTAELRGAQLALITLDACTEVSKYRNRPGRVPKLNVALCAGSPTNASSCKGDSGGPLIYYGDRDRRPRVVGVVSSGVECGQAGEEGLYTRVGMVWPWIARIMRTRP